MEEGQYFVNSLTIGYIPSGMQTGLVHTFQKQGIVIIMEICPTEMKRKKYVMFGQNWSIKGLNSDRKPTDLLQMCFTNELEYFDLFQANHTSVQFG